MICNAFVETSHEGGQRFDATYLRFRAFFSAPLENLLACRYQVDSTCAVFQIAVTDGTYVGPEDNSNWIVVPQSSATEPESRSCSSPF